MFESYVPRLAGASKAERGRIIEGIVSAWGCSKSTVYRELKKAGWCSGRQRRSDAGDTAVDPQALDMLAALIKSGVRKNGKATKDIPTARQELAYMGVCFGVSDSRLAALMRERGIDIKSQKAPAPHTRMRSLHPNHVHQVDPSMCLLYYLPSGGQKIIEDDEAYKNKPFLEGKAHLKIWRYVLTDHYSCSTCVRYYNRAGESMETLWEFLLYAWAAKDEPGYLFHGVPKLLVMDKGSANLGGGVVNALRALRVEQWTHGVGASRAKGQVEKMNDLTEKLFESRLKTQPVRGLDELNERAAAWCSGYNAGTLEGYGSVLHRAGRPRLEIWAAIRGEDLRELPDEARDLLVSRPVTRKVGGDLTVSFRHPKIGQSRPYAVGGLEGIRPGLTVTVQPILMDHAGTLLVTWQYQGEEFAEEVAPAVLDDVGFPLDAPVWGEGYSRPADTYVDAAAKRLEQLIGEDKRPFAHLHEGRGIQSVSAIRSVPGNVVHMPREGRRITPDEAMDGGAMLNPVEAAMRLKGRLGFWRPEFLDVVRGTFPGGVPAGRLDELAEALRAMGRGDEAAECAQ